MKLDVDQSIRIEQLNRDSIIGLGNSVMQYAALVPRKVKRHFMEEMRRRGQPRQFPPTLFAVSIVASLQAGKIRPAVIVVDKEYDGYTMLIEAIITYCFPEIQIEFRQIGRKSPAHLIAYEVFKKRREPDAVLSKANLQALILSYNKKTAGEPHRHVLTRVRQSNRLVKKKYTKRNRYVK